MFFVYMMLGCLMLTTDTPEVSLIFFALAFLFSK